MEGANFFKNVGMCVSGAFLGVFMTFKNPKNPKFSSLAPLALAKELFLDTCNRNRTKHLTETIVQSLQYATAVSLSLLKRYTDRPMLYNFQE